MSSCSRTKNFSALSRGLQAGHYGWSGQSRTLRIISARTRRDRQCRNEPPAHFFAPLEHLGVLAGAVTRCGRPGRGRRRPDGHAAEIIPGHYVYSVTTFNSGIVATSEGVVVLDALSSDAIARSQRDAIAEHDPAARPGARLLHVSQSVLEGNTVPGRLENRARTVPHRSDQPHAAGKDPGRRTESQTAGSDVPGPYDAAHRREGDPDSSRRAGTHTRRQHHLRPSGSHRLFERAVLSKTSSCSSTTGTDSTGCARSTRTGARCRHLRARPRTDSRRPAADATRPSCVSGR